MRALLILLACLSLATGPLHAEDAHEGHDGHADEAGDGMALTLDTAPIRAEIALTCRFTSECYESEECAETAFTPALEGRAGGLTPLDMVVEAQLMSDSGDTGLLGVASNGTYSLAGGTFEVRHLLTIAEGGAARYTVHFAEGPQVISYIGECR